MRAGVLLAIPAGLGIGWALTHLLADPSGAGPAAFFATRDAAPGGIAPERCPGETAARAGVERLEKEVARRSQAMDLGEARLVAAVGRPIPWPTALPASYTEEGIRGRMEQMLARSGSPPQTLMAVDCGEYPCVVSLHFGDQVDAPARRRAFSEAMPEGGFAWAATHNTAAATEDGGVDVFSFVAVAPTDLSGDENADRRVAFLLDEAAVSASEPAE